MPRLGRVVNCSRTAALRPQNGKCRSKNGLPVVFHLTYCVDLTPAPAYAFEPRALCHTASYAVVKTAHGGMLVDPDAEDSVVIR